MIYPQISWLNPYYIAIFVGWPFNWAIFPKKKTIPGPSLVETDQMRHGLKSKAELNAEWARVVCEVSESRGSV